MNFTHKEKTVLGILIIIVVILVGIGTFLGIKSYFACMDIFHSFWYCFG